MADEKNEPPKAAEGAGTPAQKPATEGGGASSQAKPDAGLPSKPPAPAGAETGVPSAPARPPAAAPPKPTAPVAKAPVKPEPWSNPLLDELQKRFPGRDQRGGDLSQYAILECGEGPLGGSMPIPEGR